VPGGVGSEASSAASRSRATADQPDFLVCPGESEDGTEMTHFFAHRPMRLHRPSCKSETEGGPHVRRLPSTFALPVVQLLRTSHTIAVSHPPSPSSSSLPLHFSRLRDLPTHLLLPPIQIPTGPPIATQPRRPSLANLPRSHPSTPHADPPRRRRQLYDPDLTCLPIDQLPYSVNAILLSQLFNLFPHPPLGQSSSPSRQSRLSSLL
jgi:hypothetical protein